GRRGLEQQHRVAQPRRADEAAARAQAVQDRGRTGDVARPQRACHRLGLRRQFRQEQAPQALHMAGVAVERFQRASLVPVPAALAEQAPQGLAQRGGGQRLGHHRIEAGGAQVFEHLRVVRRGVRQRRRVRIPGAQLRQQRRAVAVAELRVQQPQVECFAGGERLRLRASRGLGDPRGQGGRGRRQEGAAGRVVLDQQYAWRHRWLHAPRYAAPMSAWRLPTLALLSALAATVAAWPMPGRAQARVADASIARVVTAVATLEGVRVRLAWVPGADSGELSVHAARVDAPDLGYRYRDLAWRCPLQRLGDGWRCDGTVRSGNGAPLRLAVAFTGDDTDALLASGNRRLSLHRDAATPDDTRIDLLAVPATWAQALLAQAWEAGRLQDGTLDGSLLIRASEDRPLQVTGTLEVAGLALETPDASIAAQGIGGRVALDYRSRAGWSAFTVDGSLHGGELLMGNTYIALPETPVAIAVDAQREGSGGWEVPRFAWRDGEVLVAEGSAALGADATLQALQVDLHSNDIAPLRDRYLSGWLGLAGLGDMEMTGALDASLRIAGGALQEAVADLRDIGL